MRTAYFNGKFYAGGLNGVHRVADRLIAECDRILAAMPSANRPDAILLTPSDSYWGQRLAHVQIVPVRQAASQLWEQFALPYHTRFDILVNLANLSPIMHRRKITLIHDVQFMMSDSSYPLRQRLGYRFLMPKMAATSEIVFSVSDFSRQMMDLTGVCPRERSQRLFNSGEHILDADPELSIIEELEIRSGSFVIMFASHKNYKNIGVVLRAFEHLKRHSIDLVLVGSSREKLDGAGLRTPEGVIMAGSLSDGEVRGLYAGALALAFPSRTEGFGLPPLEAMLCGCPVVTTPAGAIPEVCRDAVLYADVDDEQSWIQAILALRDQRLRLTKISQGFERAGQFSWADAGRTLTDAVVSMCRR
jgi:glycosyltransferase involved in cell wall biosynthesis